MGLIPCARFDDHTSGGDAAFCLRGMQRQIVARSLSDVVPALSEAEAAAAAGAWVAGFVAYEAAPAFDKALAVAAPARSDPFSHLPLAWFAVFDRRVALEPWTARTETAAPYTVSAWTPSQSRAEYERAVHRIRDLIGAGETYQVNHSLRLRASFSGDSYEFYRDLVLAQRGPGAAYFDVGRYRVLSASPESFFRIDGDRIVTAPMKGTIRRGRWPEEDAGLRARLEASEKDRSENLMIVDLLRNDLGRIARFGSVAVEELCTVERFETVWQLVSRVAADLDPDASLTDVFRALFPCGSVTGAPKAATMRFIAELEERPRGVYCGAIGYLSPPGLGPRASFNVAIRTAVVDQEEGLVEYGVGGGITWDSAAGAEYEEVRVKARLLAERRPNFDLVETLRWDPGTGYRLRDAHLDRLAASADYFGFVADPPTAAAALDGAVAGATGPLRVRLTMSRTGECRVSVAPVPATPDPLRLAVDPVPVDSGNVFLFHKTTHREVYDVRRARHPGADDVLLQNERGEVCESTMANVVVRFGDEWWTPPLDSGCLGGVERARLLAAGEVRERVIAVSELASAAGIALVNSVRGWMPARLADEEAEPPQAEVVPLQR